MKRRDLFGLAWREAPIAKAVERVSVDQELRGRIAKLPLAIARADAGAELARGRLFRGTRGLLTAGDDARIALLDAESRALFTQYRAVENNELTLAVSAVAPAPDAPRFVRIGSDARLGRLHVNADAPAVYFSAGETRPVKDPAHALPSVWHLILYARERLAAR